jgi:hypothetical protein
METPAATRPNMAMAQRIDIRSSTARKTDLSDLMCFSSSADPTFQPRPIAPQPLVSLLRRIAEKVQPE